MRMKTGLFLVFVVFAITGCQTSSSKSEIAKGETVKAPEMKKILPKDDSLVPRGFDFGNAPEVIAFGSAANQDKAQPIWNVISKSNPDLFIFAGNTISSAKSENIPLSARYKKLNLIPDFRQFRESVPVMAIWDESDYGAVAGGSDYTEKEESRREFLYEWSYVKDSMRMNQKGIYHSKILGGVRKKSPTLQVILLDTRWFRSPLKTVADAISGKSKMEPTQDRKTTILGEEQWEWLERQLRKPADVRIIVSSIQLVAEDHGFEKWANFPHEKERFLNLLRRTQPRNLFVISGNRNRGVIAKQDIKGWGTLYDITSGSLTEIAETDESDKSYVGPQIKAENFGVILVDWARKKIDIQLRDISNTVVNSVNLKLR